MMRCQACLGMGTPSSAISFLFPTSTLTSRSRTLASPSNLAIAPLQDIRQKKWQVIYRIQLSTLP